MKTTTWHVLLPNEITYVTDRIAVFNDSDKDAHVEVTPSGELLVKPLDFGRLLLSYLPTDDE